MVFRNQRLGPRCVHFYWDISASGPTLWSELGNINIYFTEMFQKTYITGEETENHKGLEKVEKGSQLSLNLH